MSLEDIRTVEDNAAAADLICRVIAKLTADPNTRIHASGAGGRKDYENISNCSDAAIWSGQDKLPHLLVSEDFKQHPDFYYIPKEPKKLEVRDRQGNLVKTVSTANAKIYLAEISFIRVSGILTNWLARTSTTSYSDLVKQAQEELDLLENKEDLNINFKNKSVSVGELAAILTERELFIYALLAKFRKNNWGEAGCLCFNDFTPEKIENLFSEISQARDELQTTADVSNSRFGFIKDLLCDTNKPDKTNRESLRETFSQVMAKIKKKFQDVRLSESCLPTNVGVRGVPIYKIDFPAELMTQLIDCLI